MQSSKFNVSFYHDEDGQIQRTIDIISIQDTYLSSQGCNKVIILDYIIISYTLIYFLKEKNKLTSSYCNQTSKVIRN